MTAAEGNGAKGTRDYAQDTGRRGSRSWRSYKCNGLRQKSRWWWPLVGRWWWGEIMKKGVIAGVIQVINGESQRGQTVR